jgi:hypothetical protein
MFYLLTHVMLRPDLLRLIEICREVVGAFPVGCRTLKKENSLGKSPTRRQGISSKGILKLRAFIRIHTTTMNASIKYCIRTALN